MTWPGLPLLAKLRGRPVTLVADGERADAPGDTLAVIRLASADRDDLTLRDARALALADRVYRKPGAPRPVLDRARADAPRIACAAAPDHIPGGRSVWVERAG